MRPRLENRPPSARPPAGLRWGALALFTLAPGLGCGDEPGPEEEMPPVAERCAPDPAELEGSSCGLDEDCPCGAHCALGSCTLDCATDAECEGDRACDGFGRCRAPELVARPRPVRGRPQGALLVDRTLVQLLEGVEVQSVRVRARFEALTAVRAVGRAGVEVACGPGDDFGPDCRFRDVRPDAPPREVRVRVAGPRPDEDRRAEVAIHAPGQTRVVGVRVAGRSAPAESRRVGVYEGTARLVGAGLRARTVEDELPAELRRLELPVRLEVYPEVGGTFPVRLGAARGAVFGPGATGRLVLGNDRSWTLDVPGRAILGDLSSADPRAVPVVASGRMAGVTFSDGLIDGEYVATLEGMTAPGQEPLVRWRISATRVGALPEGAMPPGETPGASVDVGARARRILPEAEAARDLVGRGGLSGAIAAACSGSSPVTALSPSTDPNGDLLCEDGGPMRLFGIPGGRLADRGDFLASCESGVVPSDRPQVGDARAEGVCLDRTRAVTAMTLALENDRERAFGQGRPDLAASRFGLRLVQQWVSQLAFLGVEPRRVHRLAAIAPEGPDLQALSAYASEEALLRSLRASIAGWDVVLHPAVASGLASIPPEALARPDYRPAFGSPARGGAQEVGLPVTMLYTLTAQLAGLEGVLEDLRNLRAPAERADALRAELEAFLPRSVAVFALAQGLYDAARSSGPPPWEPAWQTARLELGVALNRMLRSLELLESGANPLGIDEIDLPLYRLGSQSGALDRFSAVSDSLLGREDRLEPAIAPTLVAQAAEALELARGSIRQLLQRDLAEALQQSGAERRLEALNRRYGEQIASLCGDPAFDALRVLDMADAIDPETCWLAPGCGFDEASLRDRLNVADVGYQVCVAAKLRRVYGDAVSVGQAELDRQLDGVGGAFSADSSFFSIEGLGAVVDGFASAYAGVQASQVRLPDGIDAEVAREIEAECAAARELTLAERPSEAPASCASTDDCPVDYVCRSATGTCEPDADVADPACFRGSIGEVAVAMQAAATDITIARSELQEYSERYDNAMRGCILLQQGNQAVEGALAEHAATMDELGSAKLAADIAANTAEAAKGAFSLSSPYSAVGAVAFGAAETAARSTSDTLAFRMEQAERAHAVTLERIENRAEERICYNEAEAELVGARTAALRVRRRAQELSRYFVELQNLKISLGALLAEGVASLENERQRRVSPAQLDYWLAENLELFELRMRRARRALYLAVLAVEYEFQLSSLERAQVLSARLPADLEAVIARLRDDIRRGAPDGGGNPTELLTVVSLRRNLLQLADRRSDAERRHRLSDAERFRRLLVAPRYAVYDDAGNYRGQEIPFTIQPFGALRLGDSGGIPLLSGLNCAERLWSVNASIHGEDLMAGTNTSIATVQIRKRNTFSSQWCAAREGEDTQLASTRPSRNLFVDPFSARSWTQDAALLELTETREPSAFSGATVQARLNVPRSELERESYTDGDSEALAGRGVFGDYVLFIPAPTQSVDGSAGLRLENVEDVLIRLDYVAAEAR